MGLTTRFYGPNKKGSELTIKDMDDNLYFLQSKGVESVSFSSNTLTLTNPTGGTLTTTINASSSSDRGNLIFIDSVYGDDSTGSLNDANKPFLTYSAASVSAGTGDLIVIRPGNYSEKIILNVVPRFG